MTDLPALCQDQQRLIIRLLAMHRQAIRCIRWAEAKRAHEERNREAAELAERLRSKV